MEYLHPVRLAKPRAAFDRCAMSDVRRVSNNTLTLFVAGRPTLARKIPSNQARGPIQIGHWTIPGRGIQQDLFQSFGDVSRRKHEASGPVMDRLKWPVR